MLHEKSLAWDTLEPGHDRCCVDLEEVQITPPNFRPKSDDAKREKYIHVSNALNQTLLKVDNEDREPEGGSFHEL